LHEGIDDTFVSGRGC